MLYIYNMRQRKCWILKSWKGYAVYSSLPTLYEKHPLFKPHQNKIYKTEGGVFTIDGKTYKLKRAPLYMK